MHLGAAGLSEQPFPAHGKPSAVLSYSSRRAALEMLRDTYINPTGLSLLQGPALSGKSTLIQSFIDTLHEDCAVALVDGKGLNTTNLLVAVLRQFGFNLEANSTNELLGLVRVFALQQAEFHEPPLLIVENAHELNPSALRALCELADLRVRTGSAMKIVLVSDHSLGSIMNAPAMESLGRRLLHDYHLRPMSQHEARHYLHGKLRAAGSDSPGAIFPDDVCAALWKASGGWPGILDRLALLSLAHSTRLPVTVADVDRPVLPTGTWDEDELALAEHELAIIPNAPELIVTISGKVVRELKMDKPRMLIGRADHNDIAIDSRFVSRHHALLMHHDGSTFLMDLNSSNGTFVNARRVSNYVLENDDVIMVGHHKIKFIDANAARRGSLEGTEFAETIVMKSLVDVRSVLARENTALVSGATEELPIIDAQGKSE